MNEDPVGGDELAGGAVLLPYIIEHPRTRRTPEGNNRRGISARNQRGVAITEKVRRGRIEASAAHRPKPAAVGMEVCRQVEGE